MASSTPQVTIKFRNRLLPVLVGLLLIMMLTYTHESWIIAFFVLAGMWLISYQWALRLAQGLRLHRQMRFGWARVGDRLEEQFTLTNNAMAPVLWVEVLDHSTLPNYQANQVRAVSNHSQIRWETEGVCSRRGIFSLGPTTLRTSDPFNLYVVKLHYPQSATLTVTPPIVPLPTIKVATGGRSGDERPRPKALERTETTTSVRAYAPGDDLRAIHWRTSARRGELFVRDFQHTPAGDWWIILDLEAGVQVGEGEDSSEEYAITLAASLTDRGIRAGRAVGLMAYGQDLGGPEAGLVRFRPQPGDAQRHQILQALATINLGTTPLAELLSRTRLGHLGSIIVITPNLNSQWIEMLLSRRHPETAFTVLLFDTIAFGSPHSMLPTVALLTEFGIPHYLIQPDLLDQFKEDLAHQGQWDFRISPLGRAISNQSATDTRWQELSVS